MFAAQHVPYSKTNSFSKIVLDYLEGAPSLQSFYSLPPTLDGIKEAIEKRKLHQVNRDLLNEVLKEQYQKIDSNESVNKNIDSLLSDNTFTICTAHQPNLFSGPLYFLYKILHAIKLASYLNEELKDYHFVPVFYMGSEDADLAELNHFTVDGKKYEWQTDQKGAVGRMVIDKKISLLIEGLKGQLAVEPFGHEVVSLLQDCFAIGRTIQEATFDLVNQLFGDYGLIVLIADDASLKKVMQPVFEDDLFKEAPSHIVEASCHKLSKHYNVQANPREINLFYLKDDIRERIEKTGNSFKVCNTEIHFTEDELKGQLNNHPERFSPNVILRGLYQETILPNLAFIGGGGELAYWLQLKDLFDHYHVPFPVLILRNSFVIIKMHVHQLIQKHQLKIEQVFLPEMEILNAILESKGKKPALNGQVGKLEGIYDELKSLATSVDGSLHKHVEALKVRATKELINLEKKMLRQERKKMHSTHDQVHKLKENLFPKNGLQERVENFTGFYARKGSSFINELYKHSLSLEQKMTVLLEV